MIGFLGTDLHQNKTEPLEKDREAAKEEGLTTTDRTIILVKDVAEEEDVVTEAVEEETLEGGPITLTMIVTMIEEEDLLRLKASLKGGQGRGPEICVTNKQVMTIFGDQHPRTQRRNAIESPDMTMSVMTITDPQV